MSLTRHKTSTVYRYRLCQEFDDLSQGSRFARILGGLGCERGLRDVLGQWRTSLLDFCKGPAGVVPLRCNTLYISSDIGRIC